MFHVEHRNLPMKEIRLLDLCCSAGGCSAGYKQAADDLGIPIKIIGVDLNPQPNYPFEFIQGDAIAYIQKNAKKFTHIHASPPCQAYTNQSAPQRAKGKEYPDILAPVRYEMEISGRPGVIENVMAAPLRGDIVLRGDMFGLKTLRKRKFEVVNWFCMNPMLAFMPKGVVVNTGDFITVTGSGNMGAMSKKRNAEGKRTQTRFKHCLGSIQETWADAMGIDWMTRPEMAQAIPPAYTRYIGHSFFTWKKRH